MLGFLNISIPSNLAMLILKCLLVPEPICYHIFHITPNLRWEKIIKWPGQTQTSEKTSLSMSYFKPEFLNTHFFPTGPPGYMRAITASVSYYYANREGTCLGTMNNDICLSLCQGSSTPETMNLEMIHIWGSFCVLLPYSSPISSPIP